ncbi:MAG: hypothetical protein K6E69_06960 [Treponema sp.]|uniref:hypothetical protein n=1 Tax=Treponema sp. TaxID=166 RepID=UPI00298E6C0F|nr:hypothetical protein [Treponema sp.]MCR5386844.1 hypothetical protein [Treponema sp.]
MKKFIKLVVLAVICTTILTGYSSAQSKKTKNAVTIDPALTPENSCVFFFPLGWYVTRDMIQIDPAFPHNREELKLPKLYSKPLAPGSTYLFEEMLIGSTVWDGYPTIEDSMTQSYLNYGEKFSFKGYKLKVPKEPGFYYCYRTVVDKDYVIVITKTMDEDFLKRYKAFHKKYIKKCAEAYAGTAWEPIIKEQVEVWTK